MKKLFLVILHSIVFNITYSMERETGSIPNASNKKMLIAKHSNPELFDANPSEEKSLFHKATNHYFSKSTTPKYQSLAADSTNINKILDTQGNNYLILAVRNNNINDVKKMVLDQCLDINHKNMWGNTALHHAAIEKHKDIIAVLLHDPRIDASIPNNKGLRPRDCFTAQDNNPEDHEIRVSLFVRAMLNIAVNEESFSYIVKTTTDIKSVILAIKNRINQDYLSQQQDRALPLEECLPDYADDDFIEQMILAKIK